jgi:hypothetical protein
MIEPSSSGNYGATRDRAASVSFAEIEAAARHLMAAGDYPSVAAVRKALDRGSTTTIAEAMRRFWKNQAALNAGNPVALTRLPPEFADAAVDLWEQALRLSQQTVASDDNAARAQLEHLRRDTDSRVRSVELREKEWDMAARIRERGLTEAREQVSLLVGELTATAAELRSRDLQNADLQTQLEQLRQQLSTVIAKAVARNRALRATRSASPTKKPAAAPRKSKPQRSAPRPRKARAARQARNVQKPSTGKRHR